MNRDRPSGRIGKLLDGMLFLISGSKITFQVPGLLRFAIVPFILSFIIFLFTLILGFFYLGSLATSMVSVLVDPSSGSWFSILYYPVLILSWLILLVLNSYFSFILISIIAIPFNSLLAERTLMAQGRLQPEPFQWAKWVRFNAKMLWIGVIKGILFLFAGVLLFLFALIPGLNLVTTFAACFLIGFDAMDYGFEAMGMNLSERFQFFRKRFSHFFGMSVIIFPILLVPGLLVLIYPFAVVGASNLLSEDLKENECYKK